MVDPIRFSIAIFAAGIVAWTTLGIADTRAVFNETAPPGNDPAAKPFDRSCYVRDDDGEVRYYLEGPLRDGELPYLQGQPISGQTARWRYGRVPRIRYPAAHLAGASCAHPANITFSDWTYSRSRSIATRGLSAGGIG